MDWKLVLEYLKVFLTAQVIIGAIIVVFFNMFRDEIKELIKRIAKIKLPGGGELSTPQLEKLASEKPIDNNASPGPQSTDVSAEIQENDTETLKSLLNAERARAYFWEYSYLNYYLVRNTQMTLDWFASCAAPMSLALYDSITSPNVTDPEERQAILNALKRHYLITIDNDLITVTPKGHEYIEWRGKVHQSPSSRLLP